VNASHGHDRPASPEQAAGPDDAVARLLGTRGGEMGRRIRAHDWAGTAVGPVATWPAALRVAVRLVLEAEQPMLALWGPELVIFYNDAYRPSLGDTPDRHPGALGARARDFWRDSWSIVGADIEAVLAGGGAVFHRDIRVPVVRDGGWSDAWWTYGLTPLRDDDGAAAGVLVTGLEVTESVLAGAARDEAIERQRRQLATIAVNATLALFIMDERQHCAYMNPAAERLTGFRLAEVQGKPLHDFVHHTRPDGSPYPLAECPIDRAFPQGMREQGSEVFVHRDGSFYPVAFTASPIRDEATGAPVGTIIEVRDIRDEQARDAERERLLAAEREARAAAEVANAAKAQFLANMSHELRTPLNAIGGYVQLLELGIHGPVTDAQRATLARVQGAQTRLLSLINDILNYARLESGRVEYDLGTVDVAAVVREVIPLVEPQCAAKGLVLGVALPEGPCPAVADRDKLGQVLVNLLSNAVKFTPAVQPVTGAPGRVTVGLASRAADGGGEATTRTHVFLRVEDTGIGIPRERQDAIFEPFVQVRARGAVNYAEATEGTGLGLAISRDLARGMGGELRVRSEPGRGAVFTLALRRSATTR
jgi:PAS domain S-box-containing protein